MVAGTGSMEDAMGEVLLMDERSMENNSAVIRSQRKDRASVAIENIMAPEESGRLTRGHMAALLAAGEEEGAQET